MQRGGDGDEVRRALLGVAELRAAQRRSHGYVQRWQEWPYSNAEQYLEQVGRETAIRRWRYPLYDYGNEWDPPDFCETLEFTL